MPAVIALVRCADITRTPICRFYAPPEAGGSSTHFYGRAGVPTNGACPAALPTPVFRLFNNADTSNRGNHYYLPGEIQRNEMLVARWTDEGVAFCTSDATGARPLADVIR